MNNYKKKYSGKLIDIYNVMFDDFEAEIINHSPSVCIAATNDNENFYLVEQFRYAANKSLLEYPAGLVDSGEDLEIAARRELREEIGYECEELVSLGYTIPSPGILDEIVHLYYANNLNFVG